jgi:hypothetical protein
MNGWTTMPMVMGPTEWLEWLPKTRFRPYGGATREVFTLRFADGTKSRGQLPDLTSQAGSERYSIANRYSSP